MATSTIRLYNVGFKTSQNAILDDIEDYLGTLTPVYTYTEFQYIKHALDITIKLPLPQVRVVSPAFNYAFIKNSDDNWGHYYYVNNVEWRAQGTIQVSLSLDTLNTFVDFLTFNNNTVIHRQHMDRFIKPDTIPTTSFTATRIVNRADEGLNGLVKYKIRQDNIQPYMIKWYLVYCSNQGLNVGDTSSNEAINCYLLPESDVTVSTGSSIYNGYNIATAESTYRIFTSDNVTININGVDYTNTSSRHYGFGRYTSSTSGFVVYIEGTTVTRVAYNIDLDNNISFSADTGATALLTPASSNTWSLPIYDALDKNNTSYNSDGTYTILSIDNVNRTLSYLVKIIECPYPPVDINTAVSNGTLAPIYTTELNSNGMYALKLSKLESDFNILIYNSYELGDFFCTIPALADRSNADKNILYESKIFNSATYSRVLMYDSFTLELPFENFVGGDGVRPSLDIYYKQSNAINSALYFKLEAHNGTWVQTEALENIMVCNRNNEMPIYNSSYLDYIRTGYNFDKKTKNLQLSQGLWNTGLGIAGAGLSFGLSSLTKGISAASGVSMLTSSINSITNNIYSNIAARNQIEQKKAEAKATASSVQTSDDLNLLNGYLGNKLYSFSYLVSNNMRRNIFNLYYLTGYAYEDTGIPDTTSRYRFNYLQCEPGLVNEKDPRLVKYIDDIKERFRLGVTYFHRYDDFEQLKENWESWLITS